MPEGIEYQLIRSNRRSISLEISRDGQVIVRCPNGMPLAYVQEFVSSKKCWIEKHLALCQPAPELTPYSPEEIRALGQQAVKVFPQRVEFYAPIVGVTYGKIAIRMQRTKWGSCSSKGNLNFNVLLMLAPPEVLDYIVVHELCHRKELNHSQRFWAEVEKVMPDYREKEKWLKENGGALMRRIPA